MNTLKRAKEALWAKSGLGHDKDGYVDCPDANLLDGVPPTLIKDDYDGGSGQEWLGKIRAIHSSSALVANSFGRWKLTPSSLTILGRSGFAAPKLEAKCPSGLGGTPPNLDALLTSNDTIIGIESKLLEPLTPKVPAFSSSYKRDRLPLCEDGWWRLLEEVKTWPASHLDAAQLIKHYLGLRNQFPKGKTVILLYLFWKPLNADSFDEYKKHADHLAVFKRRVKDSPAVQFESMDYLSLWESWETYPKLANHAKLMKDRYAVAI